MFKWTNIRIIMLLLALGLTSWTAQALEVQSPQESLIQLNPADDPNLAYEDAESPEASRESGELMAVTVELGNILHHSSKRVPSSATDSK